MMTVKHTPISSCASGLALALACTTPASAQDAAAPAAAPAYTGLGEIVVTATKRAERLQDVPVSVTAVSSATLERQNIRSLDDLPTLVPGLTINYGSQPGNYSINMRGIGTFSNGIAVESDVAVVIDDVPLGFQAAAFKDLIDVERVEALKGPQSTLFGKSAIAGVLNITTMAPTNSFTGHVMGLITDDNEWRIGGTVSGPLSDTLKARITASRTVWSGNVENLTTGQHLNGSKGFTVTGRLQWDPTTNVSLTLQPRYNSTPATCCVSPITSLPPGLFYQGITQLPESTVLAGIPIGPHNTYVRNDDRAGGDSRSYGGTVHAAYTLDDNSPLGAASLTYIGSLDRWRMHDYQDIDGTDVPFLLYFPVAAPSHIDSGSKINGSFHARSTTQELRLTSPGGGRLHYVFGLWYAHNYLDRLLDRGPVLQFVKYLAVSHNTNYAAFGDMTFDLTPQISLLAGGRINRQKIDYDFDNYTAAVPFHLSGANADTAETYKVGAQYHVTHNNMLYVAYSTGYKGQAYDLVSTFNAKSAAQMPVPPETAKNIEIGTKNSLFANHLYLNATLFNTSYKGFQTSVTSFLPDGTFLTFLNSVGKLRTRGVEADFLAKIGRGFTINGSGAYMDAQVRDFPNGPCFSGQTLAQGCFVDSTNSKVQNLKGKRLNNAPKVKFNVGGEYDFPLGDSALGGLLTANYRWQSKINYSLSQDPRTIQSSYGVFDLSAGVSAGEGKYKFTGFLKNAFNKHYAAGIGNTTSGFSAPGFTGFGATWQPARDSFRYFGLRADMSF